MPLEPVKHKRVRVVDVDGTVIEKKLPEEYFTTPTVALEGALEQINEWYDEGDYILFWTARPEEYRAKTMGELDALGFKYHELVCGKPYCHEIHIYDNNPMFFHQVERDQGIDKLDLAASPYKELFVRQAAEIRRLRRLLREKP